MREILFRGKRKDNGEWVEGFYVCLNSKSHRIYNGCAETDCGDYYPEWFEVIPETVGQYTGLRDCKRTKEYPEGQMIFEGDIVVSTNANRLSNKPYIVEFSAISGYWCCDPKREPVVIGNIHDNPELLKGVE